MRLRGGPGAERVAEPVRRAPGGGAVSPAWCCLRLRFDEDELKLLRASERLWGAALARRARPDALREAMALARAGHKVGQAGPDTTATLAESDVQLLAQAVRYAAEEVRWLGEHADQLADRKAIERQGYLGVAFPELVERGGWRGFGLRRGLESLSERLSSALAAKP